MMNICIAAIDDCKNLKESYGEICVKCNKCGRFKFYTEQDTCVMCGKYIPEGSHVCDKCKEKNGGRV